MKNILILMMLFTIFLDGNAQGYYWIAFTDKNHTEFRLDTPEEFLTQRAIERRITQHIQIDSLDLPVNSMYVDSVIGAGLELVHASKWLNGITVRCLQDHFPAEVEAYSFVDSIEYTKPLSTTKSASSKFEEVVVYSKDNIDSSYYGESVYQTGLLNGQFLHNRGFNGEGMVIAVLDAGFYKVDEYAAFDSLWANDRILGVKDFVDENSDFYLTHFHGMSVLSCMGGNSPGELIGTAREASYWLFRTEDSDTEYLIEEDNWVVAAEFADSVGADILNSSLGYFQFDDSLMNHTYQDMDGKTTRITKAANIAVSRGMLVFSSAGNERNNSWRYIIAPSDGDKVIGVAAVNKFGFAANFSSLGPASDGDVKPNLSAMGWNTYLVKKSGAFGKLSGTSFSSPVLAGMAACLWQANPTFTALEMKDALEKSAHLYDAPDSVLGYGIPDMGIAQDLLGGSFVDEEADFAWIVYPNPFLDFLWVKSKAGQGDSEVTYHLFSMGGRLMKTWKKSAKGIHRLEGTESLNPGAYLLARQTKNVSETIKLIKYP